MRLSTGSPSPNSANETLSNGFSSKQVEFDIISLTYKLVGYGVEIHGGKMKNPFYRPGNSQLIWDNDVTPEGVNIHADYGKFFFNLGYLVAEHRKTADDSFIHAGQIGYHHEFNNFKLQVETSYYGLY